MNIQDSRLERSLFGLSPPRFTLIFYSFSRRHKISLLSHTLTLTRTHTAPSSHPRLTMPSLARRDIVIDNKTVVVFVPVSIIGLLVVVGLGILLSFFLFALRQSRAEQPEEQEMFEAVIVQTPSPSPSRPQTPPPRPAPTYQMKRKPVAYRWSQFRHGSGAGGIGGSSNGGARPSSPPSSPTPRGNASARPISPLYPPRVRLSRRDSWASQRAIDAVFGEAWW